MIFEDETDIKRYVEQELEISLPDGWITNLRLQPSKSRRPHDTVIISDLEWEIFREVDTGEPFHDYLLRISKGYDIIYGNSDAGPRPHIITKVIVISTERLIESNIEEPKNTDEYGWLFPLSFTLSEMFDKYEQNMFGCS